MQLAAKAQRKESKTEKGKPTIPTFAEEEKKAVKVNPLVEAVSITVDEKIVATISKDGDLGKFEVRGEIFLYVNDESKANAEVHLSVEDMKGVAIKPHPELNRTLWTSQQIIAPKQGAQGFPVNTKLEALKYKYSTNNASDLPLNITVWNATEGKVNVITLEAEFNAKNPKFAQLANMKIIIPLGTAKEPQITKVENSEVNYMEKEHMLEWSIEKLDSSKITAGIELKTQGDLSSIFPFDVRMSYPYSILGAKVIKVQSGDTKQPLSYAEKISMTCENYQIVLEL